MHRFAIGDTVIFDPGVKGSYLTPESIYQIVSLVPREDNVTEYLYRIRSTKEAMERVVRESQLTPHVD